MRILVVTNLYPPEVVGGYEILCAQMVEALAGQGHEVLVLTSVPPRLTDVDVKVLRTLGHPDVFSSDRPAARSEFWEIESNLLNSANVFQLVITLRRFQPDVCYLWNLIGIGGLGLVGALEYLGVPWLWHLGDAVPAYLCVFQGSVLPVANELSRRLSGRFIAVSQGLVNHIERVVSLRGRVRLVPNWVLNTEHALERHYFDGGELRMAFAGRLSEEKGVHVLIEAAERLVNGGRSDFSIDLYGQGERQALMRHVAAAGLSGKVRLQGWVPQSELRRRLRQYDLLVFPTFRQESFGMAPFEAAAEGCVPLISTPSGPAEWLVDGVDCLKAQRSGPAFAEVIDRVMRGDIQLGPIGRRAASVVRRDFVLSDLVLIIEEELSAAASQRRSPMGDEASLYHMAVIAESLIRSAVSSAGHAEPEVRTDLG